LRFLSWWCWSTATTYDLFVTVLIGTNNNNQHNEQQSKMSFFFIFSLCSYVDNKNRVLSLSLSLLLFCLQKWSFVLARSFTLRNSLMSLVSLSSQPIFLVGGKKTRKSIFIYKYEKGKTRDKNRIESNTMNSINLFFFRRFKEEIVLVSLLILILFFERQTYTHRWWRTIWHVIVLKKKEEG
jgi:hypothetical protein